MLSLPGCKQYMFSVSENLAVVYVRTGRSVDNQSLYLPAILNRNSNDASLEVPVSHVLNDDAVIPVIPSVNGTAPSPAEKSG